MKEKSPPRQPKRYSAPPTDKEAQPATEPAYPSTPAASQDAQTRRIIGNVDAIGKDGIQGWLVDSEMPSRPLSIHAKVAGLVVGEAAANIHRTDVNNSLKVEGSFGFHLRWDIDLLQSAVSSLLPGDELEIEVICKEYAIPLMSRSGVKASVLQGWLTLLPSSIQALTPFSEPWKSAVKDLNTADLATSSETVDGFLEMAFWSREAERFVIAGWLCLPPGAIAWISDDEGGIYPLDEAFRYYRSDVYNLVGNRPSQDDTRYGLVCTIPAEKMITRVDLFALTLEGRFLVSTVGVSTLPSAPIEAAKILFSVQCPLGEFAHRVNALDMGVLGKVIEHQKRFLSQIRPEVALFGASPDSPLVSVIVPLYGRTDFIEHQLLELTRDDWCVEHVELIYVVDDPNLVEGLLTHASYLHSLFDFPFKIVNGKANRGFSGANNLGVEVSKGQLVLFMNSDVIPKSPGWLQPLVEVLDERPEVGIVGPQLVYHDGGIQHAGITFRWRRELGVWVNHHPHQGLSEALFPAAEPREVPALTGACMLMRRSDFERIGGWDTGYLIGDFEDSDLCLKMKEEGGQLLLIPAVTLVHLERQSYRSMEDEPFRLRVTLYNAARHQSKWRSQLENCVTAGS